MACPQPHSTRHARLKVSVEQGIFFWGVWTSFYGVHARSWIGAKPEKLFGVRGLDLLLTRKYWA